MYNYVDRIREDGQMKEKINKWLEQCPVDYDVIEQTSDKDVVTINFHSKNIYNEIKERCSK